MNLNELYNSVLKDDSDNQPDMLLECFPVACGCLDIECNLVAANQKWKSIFDINDISNFGEILSKDRLSRCIQEAQEADDCQFELQVRNKAGEQIKLAMSLKPAGPDMFMACAQKIDIPQNTLNVAGEKAMDSQEINELFLSASPFAVDLWDEDHNIVDCNEQTLKLFSLSSKAEYIECFDKLSPEFQPCGRSSSELANEHMKNAFANGTDRFEFIHQNIKGELIPTEVTLVRIAHKGRHMLVGYIVDLRFLKANMEKEMEEDERAMLMLDATPLSCYLIRCNIEKNSVTFEAIDCNQAAFSLFGFSGKEEALTRFHDIFPESAGGNNFREIYENTALAMEEGYNHLEFNHMHTSGEIIPCEVTLVRVKYKGESVLACYHSDLRPIKAAMAKERENLELAQMFIDSAPFFVEIWDKDLNLLECNKTAASMFGLADTDEYMRIFNELSPEYQPDGVLSSDKIQECIGAAFREGRSRTEWLHVAPDGSPLPVDVTYVRLKRGDDYIVVGYNMDLRKIKAAIEKEQESKKLREDAEAANKAKSAFLSTMSHEIRTPMNAILGITEIQLMNSHLEAEVREAFEKIYVSGDLLLGIINDILDLSKIEAGKLSLLSRKYDLASLISDVAQLNVIRIGSKRIEFNLYIDENIPAYMFGDELRIKQILNNILSNAFKYTEAGEVALHVSFEKNENENDEITLIFSVSDTGEGLSEEQVRNLFDEYTRFNTEANRKKEGTGLGMAITRNLVNLMGGEISVESEPKVGSTFTVRLPQGYISSNPLGKENVESLYQFRTIRRKQGRMQQVSRERMPYGSVLIVDDVETNIYVAKGLMVSYELKVDSASSGIEAIEKIKNGNVYDIIFMDHMMPMMDGVETTNHLREMGYKHPIVALTANALSGQSEIFMENGFDDFLSKPIDVRQLNMVLNKLVRDKHPEEAAEINMQAPLEETAQANQQEVDLKFAEIFLRDAKKSIEALEMVMGKGPELSDDDLRIYIVHVHGMKSALSNVKKTDLADIAARLESEGRKNNLEVIVNETPMFLDDLKAFVEEITPADDTSDGSLEDVDFPYLREKLNVIKDSCEEYDTEVAEDALSELKDKVWPRQPKKLIDAISMHLLRSDYEEIVEAIEEFLEKD